MARVHHHPNFWAFVLHRASGLLLAVFLPFHFWALGLALHGEAQLDAFLHWTDHPAVKLSELSIVFLLAAHLTGGVRLLAVELLPWREQYKTLASITTGIALVIALIYLLNLV